MAGLSGAPTFIDMAKRTDPSGKAAVIAEVLDQANPITQDAEWVESNSFYGHQFTARTSLPTANTVGVNEGVAPDMGTTDQKVESITMIRTVSEVAKDVAEFGGNLEANLKSELEPHIEAVGQKFSQLLGYGNQATKLTDFTGFGPRFSSLSGAYAQNLINAGGTQSDNSSIYLVGWGKGKVYCAYPKGSAMGLDIDKRGLQTVDTAAGMGAQGGRLLAYQTFFTWKCGLVVHDWRYLVRICNIDISNLVTDSSAADLFKFMIKAIARIPNLRACRPVFYMNRSCYEMLDIQGRTAVINGGGITYDNVDGKPIMFFRGIPIRLWDQLLETEAQVT